MLTRLKISGFKSLVDVDVHFGPFTCIAGANGVGKSNLFDAIRFLSLLANSTFAEAAATIRDEDGKTGDIRTLFHRRGNEILPSMKFEAEILIPRFGVDDLNLPAEASITFLNYRLELALRDPGEGPSPNPIRLIREELDRINLTDAYGHLAFPLNRREWGNSVLFGRRTSPFISTHLEDGENQIKLRQDGSRGRPRTYLASELPRTIISGVNAAESPTALIAKREMQAWRLLQLEPSALRNSDDFLTRPGLGAKGEHLPATLYHLSRKSAQQTDTENGDSRFFESISARLSELVEDVERVWIERDEKRQQFTLMVRDRNGTVHPARALSDGTLRFLALAAIESDPEMNGMICLEEPENGIHPDRIGPMLELLEDIAVDTEEPVDEDNPLRQVIINTHSPAVVRRVPEDSLLVAEAREGMDGEKPFTQTEFRWLPNTWRSKHHKDVPSLALGTLLAYLDPGLPQEDVQESAVRRVGQRRDLRQMTLPLLNP
jgi:predicted ATPase